MDIIVLLIGSICVIVGMFLIPFHKKVKAEKAHAFAFLIIGVLTIVVPFILGLLSVSELATSIIATLIMFLISAVILVICYLGFGNKKKYMDFYAKCEERHIVFPFSEKQKQEVLLIAKNYGLKDAKSASKAYEKGKALADADAGEKFQFVRNGYFCKDTKYENTFNRVVGLKDSFPKKQ